MSTGKKPLLVERLNALLSSLDHLENPERNARIIELTLGLDGNGTHTLEEIQLKLDVEFPNEKISRERIRVLRTSGVDNFQKLLKKKWDSFFDDLYDYVYQQSPIEVGLLAKRLAEPAYESFELTHPQQAPFSEREFDVSGLVKLFDCRPSKLSKKVLKLNRVYFDFTKSKIKSEGPTPRNSIECLLFLVPNSFGTKLDVLLSHTERAIKFNGMLQEQALLPLMPKKLPVHKREELAHSLLVGHKDFLWLDQNKGYFTFTSSLDNRVSRFGAKVFSCTDEIHVSLFASQISRSVRSQARVLKGESSSQHLQERSHFLQNASYGSDNPFTVNDAIRYFVGTKLCTIDANNVLRPTSLFKEKVNVSLRWAEEVLISVLKEAHNQTLSQADFKAQGMKRMSDLASEKYIERLDAYCDEGRVSKVDHDFVFSSEFLAELKSKTRSSVEQHKQTLASSRDLFQAHYLQLISGYKEKLKICNANRANVRTALREAKANKGTTAKVIAALNNQSSDLRLLEAECADFSQRHEKLSSEITRLEKSLKKYVKVGLEASKAYKEEKNRKFIAERHLALVDAVLNESNDDVVRLINDMSSRITKEIISVVVELDDDATRLSKAELLLADEVKLINEITELKGISFTDQVENQKFVDIFQYRFLSSCLSILDDMLENVPDVNDKIDDMLLDKLSLLNGSTAGDITVEVSSFVKDLLASAKKVEMSHALGHFNQHVSYSPVLLRVRKAEYSYVGSEASKHAEIEYL